VRKAFIVSVLALVAALLYPSAASAALPDWNMTGQYQITFAGSYFHTMTIDVIALNTDPGTFSGTGVWNDDPVGYTWTVTGHLDGSKLDFHIVYTGTGAGYWVDAIGTVAADGTLSGTGIDSSNFSFSWYSTSGTATALEGPGLWPSNHQADVTNCDGYHGPDTNNFCYATGEGGVELGVRFTTSVPIDVVGVRIYRVDAGSVTGSLWSGDGTQQLATGSFAPKSDHGWQDLVFSQPVAIVPGQTYVASYHAPSGDYAFEYSYAFPKTVGPITALGGVNGVYTYCGPDPCFPATFSGTNYWVTPLWADTTPPVLSLPSDITAQATGPSGAVVTFSATAEDAVDGVVPVVCIPASGSTFPLGTTKVDCSATDTSGNKATGSFKVTVNYAWLGFFSPVDKDMLNKAKAGSAIPVKFSLGGDMGLDIFTAGYPASRNSACVVGDGVDPIEETVTAGGSSLSYDPSTGVYTYVWKTQKAWATKCRELVVKLADGSEHVAYFKFT